MTDTTKEQRPLLDIFAEHAGIAEAPDGLTLGWKSVRRDLRTSNGYRWPWPGGLAKDPRDGVDLDPSTAPDEPCPGHALTRDGRKVDLGGVCVALTALGAKSGGIPLGTVMLLGYRDTDVLGRDADKLRVAEALVLDVVDAQAALRARGVGANLRRANLGYGSHLYGANLYGSNLYGTDLRRADLTGADLTGADLRCADLRGAVADARTIWPEGFDPEAAGVVVW